MYVFSIRILQKQKTGGSPLLRSSTLVPSWVLQQETHVPSSVPNMACHCMDLGFQWNMDAQDQFISEDEEIYCNVCMQWLMYTKYVWRNEQNTQNLKYCGYDMLRVFILNFILRTWNRTLPEYAYESQTWGYSDILCIPGGSTYGRGESSWHIYILYIRIYRAYIRSVAIDTLPKNWDCPS